MDRAQVIGKPLNLFVKTTKSEAGVGEEYGAVEAIGFGTKIDFTSLVFYHGAMSSVVTAPVDWVESVGNLRLPSKADHRLQDLMDRNNEGLLSNQEREELEALVELSERLSLVRAEALEILGKRPE